ncbi:hypothetical protein LJC59_01120 [Desulfovibrio sp. OttesenSCG-928-A18]|nr:hypothetical protein [Desulfovibrio sp. OttesenSCG-928-A18]
MRSFLLTTLALLMAVLHMGTASAGLKNFPYFSIDVPPGWVIYDEGITVAFISPDKESTLTVTVEFTSGTNAEGLSAEELAHAYARDMHGTSPVMEDGDPNYYSFEFKSPDDVPSEASIVVSGRRFYLITVTGSHRDMAGMVESVLISIQ